MRFLRQPAAIVAAAAVIVSAPGPACYEAAAQTIGSASKARVPVPAGAASVSGAGVVSALVVPALGGPALGLPMTNIPSPAPVPVAASVQQQAIMPLAQAMAPTPEAEMPGRLDELYTGGVPKAGADVTAVAGAPGEGGSSGLEESSRRYFEQAAQGTWRGFFEDHISEHGLPYDNVQWLETHDPGEKDNLGLETLPDGTIRYAPTSPTNIGYYLTAVAAARSFGWISRDEALSRVRRTLKTLGQMEKWHGHLYNFYDARTLAATSRFVSTVDSGNLAAGLIAVGNLLPETRDEARALADAMDFGPLYDEEKGLLRVGYDAPNKAPDANHYGDYLSEARLAYLLAIGQGSIPAEAWSRLDRAGSLDGGAMDHLAPLAFIDEPGREGDVRAQVKDVETFSGLPVWGKSEAAYLQKDEAGRWRHRYGRFGAAGLASKKYGPGVARKEKVVSPYVSFLTLAVPGVDAGGVKRNLRACAGAAGLSSTGRRRMRRPGRPCRSRRSSPTIRGCRWRRWPTI